MTELKDEKPKAKRKPKAAPKPKTGGMKEADQKYLEQIGFDFGWLQKLAEQYGFSGFQYMHKFRAFRCLRDDVHVEWIDVNELALLNGARRLCDILLKHQPVGKARQIIDLPWRNLN